MPLSPRLNFPSTFQRYFERRFSFPMISVLIILGGVLIGTVTGSVLDLKYLGKEVGMLNTPGRPNSVITVYADDGKSELGQYAVFLHSPLKYEQIPDVMKKAIMAIEEPHFLEHDSLNPLRMAHSAVRTFTLTSADDGPTLAQAVSKILVSRNLTFKGKLQNWLLGIQIERLYTKDQIIGIYLNHCPLGDIVYGVEAGAQTYFAKPAGILTLEEAALLAGMSKAANYYSPAKNIQAAQDRRNQVLNLMAAAGYVTPEEAETAKAKPVLSSAISPYLPHYSEFNYPLEEIRKYIGEKYSGFGDLKVYSTININAQRKATQEVREELRRLDSAKKFWRSTYINIGTNSSSGIPTQEQLDLYQHPDWYGDIYRHDPYERETYATGLVTRVDSAAKEITVRFGSYTATLRAGDMGWSGKQPDTEFKLGDLAEFHIRDVIKANKSVTAQLSQIPAARAALMTLHAGTGEIIAMVGGYDLNNNNSNDATQALRQTGAAFKPFICAAAVEWGMTPDTPVSGNPIKIGDWQPRNYDGSTGSVDLPLKTIVSRSVNIPVIHLLQTVGIQTGAQMVRRFGIQVPMSPYLPSALGTTEMPLDQVVSAYSVFPNKGVRVEPHMIRRIETGDGKVIEEWEKTTYSVVNEYVALTLVDMMRNAFDDLRPKVDQTLPGALAGTLGISNDRDTEWFIGYTPIYVTGVWIGSADGKQPLEAEPIDAQRPLRVFSAFMEDFLRDKPEAKEEQFSKPPSMPEDMKELFRQRQVELEAERAELKAEAAGRENENAGPPRSTRPRLEEETLPPPPRFEQASPEPALRPRVEASPPRPRESDSPSKKRGKKGDGP